LLDGRIERHPFKNKTPRALSYRGFSFRNVNREWIINGIEYDVHIFPINSVPKEGDRHFCNESLNKAVAVSRPGGSKKRSRPEGAALVVTRYGKLDWYFNNGLR
jgi:hypothetical protein